MPLLGMYSLQGEKATCQIDSSTLHTIFNSTETLLPTTWCSHKTIFYELLYHLKAQIRAYLQLHVSSLFTQLLLKLSSNST